MKYKGIDKEKIVEIERLKLPHKREFIEIDFSALEKSRIPDLIQSITAVQEKKEREDTDMYIICEMAIMYLELLESEEVHLRDCPLKPYKEN